MSKEIMETTPEKLKEMAKQRMAKQQERLAKLEKTPFDQLSKRELAEVLAYKMKNMQNDLAIQQSKIGFDVGEAKHNTIITSKLVKSLIGLQGEIESKIDTVIDFLKEQYSMTDREFEDKWDSRRGLVRLDDGVIENGDTVWVNYQAKIPEQESFNGDKAENWPVRVGSGAFYGEDHLLGKSRAEGTKFSFDNEFDKEYPVKEVAGKRASFDIEIIKVKTRKEILEKRK